MNELIKEMNKSIDNYWVIKLKKTKEILESNNFTAYIADSAEEAKRIVLDEILPQTEAKSISWGGSMTVYAAGLYEIFNKMKDINVINVDEPDVQWEILLERRRQALLADLFISGTNAITESGQLINLDAVGNRVSGITFGPRHVVILAGRNKIVPDLKAAMNRIKEYTAPVNSMRLNFKTPCAITGYCEDCKSQGRICNVWTITEKSWEKGRIKVILINQDLGL